MHSVTSNSSIKETKKQYESKEHKKGIESLEYRFFHATSM